MWCCGHYLLSLGSDKECHYFHLPFIPPSHSVSRCVSSKRLQKSVNTHTHTVHPQICISSAGFMVCFSSSLRKCAEIYNPALKIRKASVSRVNHDEGIGVFQMQSFTTSCLILHFHLNKAVVVLHE